MPVFGIMIRNTAKLNLENYETVVFSSFTDRRSLCTYLKSIVLVHCDVATAIVRTFLKFHCAFTIYA